MEDGCKAPEKFNFIKNNFKWAMVSQPLGTPDRPYDCAIYGLLY